MGAGIGNRGMVRGTVVASEVVEDCGQGRNVVGVCRRAVLAEPLLPVNEALQLKHFF